MTRIINATPDQIEQTFREFADQDWAAHPNPDNFKIQFAGRTSLGAYRGLLTYLSRWGQVDNSYRFSLQGGIVEYDFDFLVLLDRILDHKPQTR